MTTAAEPPASSGSPVAAASADWRRELMELGGPNTLIWPARDPDILDLTRAHPGGVAMLLAGREVRLSDLVREPDALHRLQRKAVRLAAHAEEIAQEHGVHTCFLSMGTATWAVPGQDERPVAPVILRRARLRRLPGGTDFALDLDQRVQLNPALTTYISRALRRDLDADALIARGWRGSGFNPEPIYAALRRDCADLPELRIERRLLVATHPYGKAEALADLTATATKDDPPAALTALAGGPPIAPRERNVATSARHAVLDLPLEQQRVLDRATAGEDLYVEAAPGTDPEGLVAAVLIEAARTSQRVLLLTEKPAVVDTVRARLATVGLAGLLGHVDDPAAEVDPRVITERWPAVETPSAPAARTTTEAEGVTAHVRAIHAVREPWGVSVADAHDAIVALASHRPAPRSRVRLSEDVLAATDQAGRQRIAERLTALAREQAWRPEKADEPWIGARLDTDDEVDEALAAVQRLRSGSLDDLRRVVREVFADVAEPRGVTPGEHGTFLAQIEKVRDTLEVFRSEVFDTPLEPMLQATSDGGDLGLLERRRLRAQARALLRPGRPPTDLNAALRAADAQRRSWSRLTGGGGRPRIPADIDRAHHAYERVYADLTHLSAVLADTIEGGELLATPWDELEERLARLARDEEGARIVPRVTPQVDALRADGLGPLFDDLVERRVPAGAVADEVDFVWWMSVRDHVAAIDPDYGQARGTQLEGALTAFADVDRDRVRRNAAEMVARQRGRFRELALSRREVARDVADVADGRRGGPAWRGAFARWGALLHAAAPAWAMSPSVVGQVLPADERVDLVVVADASRTTLARCAAAIARGHRVLIVGDRAGLPPASWTADAGVHAPTAPARSLADAAAEALPTVELREVPGTRPPLPVAGIGGDRGGLTPTPVPVLPRPPGLVLVDGRAALDERTGTVATTPAEVEAVLTQVRDRLRRGARSLGVLTFSDAHAAAVTTALATAAAGDAELAAGLDALAEPLLVRTARRWQGEGRDEVVVSLGYGRTPQGRPTTRLGEVGGPVGDRLVRLAATRARRWAVWVSALSAKDVAAAEGERAGVEALRGVLDELAGDPETAPWPSAAKPDGEPTLIADMVARLRADHLAVRTDLDLREHPVAFVVADPEDGGRFTLAVDIDGPPADDLAAAREHGRRRQERLEELGWAYLRLWSTEVYADPARQEARIAHAMRAARQARDDA